MSNDTTEGNEMDPLQQMAASELVGLATRIRSWQELRKLSDNELLRRMPGLGSTKTYTRILKGDVAELDFERWATEYRAVLAVIESMAGRERVEEVQFDDLSTVVALRRALVEILDERSIRRVILIEAESGLGKSTAIDVLQRKYGQRLLRIEATSVWADNPNCLLGAILDSLGVHDQPAGRDGKLRLVVRKLSDHRLTLCVDEAHHLGPDCLNAIKTLINQTPCEVLLAALPTLWRRLERANWEEVKQLLGNRLAERIKVGALREADVRKLLQRRAKVEDPKAAALVLKEATSRGNLSFVAAVCARLAAQERDGTPTLEDVVAAVDAEVRKR